MRDHSFAVYILSSPYKHLYIGVTGDLEARITAHKAGKNPHSFTARYRINQLVYVERFGHINLAIARETQLKGWLRIRKVSLIVATNPTWRDLSLDWGTPIAPFAPTPAGLLTAP